MSKVRDKKRAKGRAHAAKVKERNKAAGEGMSYSLTQRCFKRGILDHDQVLKIAAAEQEVKSTPHHKDDAPRHGAGSKARQQVQSTLDQIMAGIKGVRIEAELVEMVGDRERPVPGSKFEVGDTSIEMPAPEPKVTTFAPTDVHPSEEDWNELVETARKRKRSIKSFAEKKGWSLIGEDPKARTNWQA